MKFHTEYLGLLTDIFLEMPENIEVNNRTNTKVAVNPGSVFFKCSDLIENILPLANNRAFWPHIAAAECAWQLLKTQDPEFIMGHAPRLWSQFLEDGIIKTAYGHRWSHHFGRDQIDLAVSALQTDPSNRQVWVQAWDPATDGLGQPNQPLNIPCPIGFSLNIVQGRLHMSVFMRSSDVFVGLPYDVMCYGLTQKILANTIGVEPGFLSFTLAHAHIYEPHFEALKTCAEENNNLFCNMFMGEAHKPSRDISIKSLTHTIDDVVADPNAFVEFVKELAKATPGNTWNPKPVVVQ